MSTEAEVEAGAWALAKVDGYARWDRLMPETQQAFRMKSERALAAAEPLIRERLAQEVEAAREWRVHHPHPDSADDVETWTEHEAEKQADHYATAGYLVEFRSVGPWVRYRAGGEPS